MAQSTKFIDVTRTYLPVDPNSFPLSLHGASKEDSPEQKIPVMAYKGYNFLPTSYGYKSYFGTAQSVGIDALVARVDFIFIYQNQGYENILIALTDSGVWTKKGSVAGAWVNDVPLATDIDPNVHYQWTYTIIADILYAYRQGQPSYQKFVHNSITQLTITSIAPNFLNMEAQAGIFKAAGRLAFWDSADSVGWANLDNFADFEPSLETLAGNATFVEVQGRIVTILPHGPGFIIYATKSIVYVAQSIESLYQWNPVVISPNCGIAYPRQASIASPDTMHFAYTNEGMAKIQNAKLEIIVPEVTDFLKDYKGVTYLTVLEGRYLFLELTDADYITGLVQITDEVVPATTYSFSGASIDIGATTPDDGRETLCTISDAVGKGLFNEFPTFPDRDITKPMQPVYTCYFSNNGNKDISNITWGAIPCPTVGPDGVEVNMNPSGPKIENYTQDSSNKTASFGPDAWFDLSGWTMQRFVATQTAIWDAEDANLKAYIAAITNRNKLTIKNTNVAACAVAPVARNECTIGRYVNGFSGPQFGYSECAFWLTRKANSAIDLVRVKANSTTCSSLTGETYTLWGYSGGRQGGDGSTTLTGSGAIYGSTGDALAYVQGQLDPPTSVASLGPVFSSSPSGTVLSYAVYINGAPAPADAGTIGRSVAIEAHYDKTERMDAYNKAIDVADFGVSAVESAYCELSHWSYTNEDGVRVYAPATSCTAPTSYPKNTAGTKPGKLHPPISRLDGSICGAPYEVATIGGYVANWPSTTVTFPVGSFLLQKGSQAPVYPTFEGALVYDLQLKKWGKMKLRYKQLLDYSPINSTLNGVVPSNVFGIMAGALGANGKISIFDARPADSYISYGKVGYYRQGMTSPEEVRVQFRTASTGVLKVETSLEGRDLSAGFVVTQDFTNATEATLYGAYPGRWCNIEISGIYDINYLEFRGFTQGRR